MCVGFSNYVAFELGVSSLSPRSSPVFQRRPSHTDRGAAVGGADKEVPEGTAARTEEKEDSPPAGTPRVER